MPTTATVHPDEDLARRVAEARSAEEPLQARVSQLDAALADAVSAWDYKAADKITRELESARFEWVVAHAATQGLEAARDAFTAQRQADTEAIQQQRQHDQARQAVTAAQQAEQDAIDELHQLVASVQAGLQAVRQNIAHALAVEQRATQYRQDRHTALVGLGEDSPRPIIGPNAMTVLLERDPVLTAVWTGQV